MNHPIVSEAEWLAARRRHLMREKDLQRQLDDLYRQRRELPWTPVNQPYVFFGPRGQQRLADLFDGHSQLILQHFMFAPDWEEGCVGCSFQAEHVDAAFVHLQHHDVSFAAVSRAPWPKLEAFRRRMGWKFHWVSSYGNDFNYDFGVSFRPEDMARGPVTFNFEECDVTSEELPGVSVFTRDAGGAVFRTYSTYGSGSDLLVGAYNFLDMTPNGRNENGPAFDLTDWVRLKDRYETASSRSCCRSA